ncbi:hypothetical protein COS75_01115 [Candidatus Pacearchaeota archaeon CG06_land_8_20_14_3_00_35_12]|nr:MAG: hypothetical protein COS75_01115 [Candidatus Pacearchaeota archaeon CG06_land_8_20_14_3_00_35_12]
MFKKKNKKAQFAGFKWLLSIIIGAVILFLALYFAGIITGTTGQQTAMTVSQQISVLLDPFSFSGISEAASKEMKMPAITLMNFSCDSANDLIKLDVAVKKTAKGKATEVGKYSIYNKYIFSAAKIETKEFYVFAKPIDLPFHIANSVYIIDKQYCFVSAPQEIKDEIDDLNITSIVFENSTYACDDNSVSVCFEKSGCDISVYGQNSAPGFSESKYDFGYTTNNGARLEYITKSLMYASIFSDSNIYKCNLQRLNKKITTLVAIYSSKASSLSSRGCILGSTVSELNNFKTNSDSMLNNQPLAPLFISSKNLLAANSNVDCKIF